MISRSTIMTPADKERLLAKFNCNPPADASSLRKLEREAGLRLPEDYAQFLQQADGGEGFVGNAYLILWRIGELLEMNKAYHVDDYAPGLFVFGSDGGGEAFAFDMHTAGSPIVSVPFIVMDLTVRRPLGENFRAFLETLLKS
jgi:hypothetical protein